MEEIQYWQERCSICFDNRLDFCLEHCRDQFCRQCFNRYVSELVKSSWGMSIAKIKCPVCYDSLEPIEWSRYVEKDVYQLYVKNSQPYKTLSRCCPHCAAEVCVTHPFQGAAAEREEVFEQVQLLLSECIPKDSPDKQKFIEDYNSLYRRHLFGNNMTGGPVSVSEIYRLVSAKLISIPVTITPQPAPDNADPQLQHISKSAGKRRFSKRRNRGRSVTVTTVLQVQLTRRNNRRRRFSDSALLQQQEDDSAANNETKTEVLLSMCNKISALLISLESDPESWRELQFLHLNSFPKYLCSKCGKRFCFQCNEPTWHLNHTCLEWMADYVKKHDRSVSSSGNPNVLFAIPEQDDESIASPSTESLPESIDSAVELKSPILESEETVATYKWKLENSKPCPRCCAIINREEGCNKVDCPMCGNRFCWVCLSSWSEKCGFYRCRMEPSAALSPDAPSDTGDQSNNDSNTQNDKPELGVPNVSAIHSRRNSIAV